MWLLAFPLGLSPRGFLLAWARFQSTDPSRAGAVRGLTLPLSGRQGAWSGVSGDFLLACSREGLVQRSPRHLGREASSRVIANMGLHLLHPLSQLAAPAEGGSSAQQWEWARYRRGGRGIKFIDGSNSTISTQTCCTQKLSSASLNKFSTGRYTFCERKSGKAGLEGQ